jgi:hypothetical protein
VRYWGWLTVVVRGILVIAGIAAFVFFVIWLIPGSGEKGAKVNVACHDANVLRDARLLADARRGYAEIAQVDDQAGCLPGAKAATHKSAHAARVRERGDVYMAAFRLTKQAGIRDGLRRAARRARRAYVAALTIDPYDAPSRRNLDTLIAALDRPADRAMANARCALGGDLRRARLLREAQMAYAQALRSGHNTACVAGGLRKVRLNRGEATLDLERARLEQARGEDERARRADIAALTSDPSLSEARDALKALPGPDPHEGEPWGRIKAFGPDLNPVVEAVGDVVAWLGQNIGLLVIVTILVLLLYLLCRIFAMRLTANPTGARIVGLAHTPDFTRLKLRIAPFTPDDSSRTSTALFAHWLPVPPIHPAPGGEGVVRQSESPFDVLESPATPEDPLADLTPLVAAFPQFGAAAAVLKWVQAKAPRRETHFAGQTLEICDHGAGLRVQVSKTRGAPVSNVWWASMLPGPPYDPDHEAEARHALAMLAAAWAHHEALE